MGTARNKRLLERKKMLILALAVLACTAQNGKAPAGGGAIGAAPQGGRVEAPRRPAAKERPARSGIVTGDPAPPQPARGEVQEARLEDLRGLGIKGGQLLSPRSLSVRLRFLDDSQAVFKPLRRDDRRAPYEVAAFRIAKLLHVGRVPPSTMRELDCGVFARWVAAGKPDAAKDVCRGAVGSAPGRIAGAVMDWAVDIEPAGFERFGGWAEVERWLARPVAPNENAPPLVKAAANMVVFDYVIGNWDRFSGGNFFPSSRGDEIVLIDHHGGFISWIPARTARMEKRLEETKRFSADLVGRLRALDTAAVEGALALEPWHRHAPLLDSPKVALLLERRDRVLAAVARLIGASGEERVVF